MVPIHIRRGAAQPVRSDLDFCLEGNFFWEFILFFFGNFICFFGEGVFFLDFLFFF